MPLIGWLIGRQFIDVIADWGSLDYLWPSWLFRYRYDQRGT